MSADDPRLARSARPVRSNPLLSIVRLTLSLIFTLYCAVMVLLEQWPEREAALRYEIALRWQRKWSLGFLRVFGWRLKVSGPMPPPACILAPNHVSYADITALAAAVDTFYVPKSELAGWPIIGPMIRVAGHPLVSRNRGRNLRETVQAIADRLDAGRRVCIFLEGTTTGGDRVLPFLPALLKPAIDLHAPIVPVAIVYRTLRPGMSVFNDVAYWRNMVFLPHLVRLLGLGPMEIEIRFGQPCLPQPAPGQSKPDRKQVAVELREQLLQIWESTEFPEGPAPIDHPGIPSGNQPSAV